MKSMIEGKVGTERGGRRKNRRTGQKDGDVFRKKRGKKTAEGEAIFDLQGYLTGKVFNGKRRKKQEKAA